MPSNQTIGGKPLAIILIGGLTLGTLPACESLPGSPGQQGAVAGGVGGAVIGAAVAENALLGGLIGAGVGALGGYLIGANWDKITGNDRAAAESAVRRAEAYPATAEQARSASTADVNSDGFVTLDEVIAMQRAGFSDDEMIRRLRNTDQIFELTSSQEQRLRDAGVSSRVVSEMRYINQDKREQLLRERGAVSQQEVISRPAYH
jgi:hypothetical protein